MAKKTGAWFAARGESWSPDRELARSTGDDGWCGDKSIHGPHRTKDGFCNGRTDGEY